jgi:hypothetical protein
MDRLSKEIGIFQERKLTRWIEGYFTVSLRQLQVNCGNFVEDLGDVSLAGMVLDLCSARAFCNGVSKMPGIIAFITF